MEVLLLIKEQELRRAQANRTRKGQAAAAATVAPTKPQNLLTIEFEVRWRAGLGSFADVLVRTPRCSRLGPRPPRGLQVKKYLNKGSIKHLTPDTMHTLMQALSKYPLTKAEKLQILNLRPTEAIELHVVRFFWCTDAMEQAPR